VLSLLLAAGAVTAVIAGIAGAWSPCGFSMIDTIGTALGDARRAAMIVATTTFTIGALAGGAITFGGLSLLGGLLGHGATELRDSLAGALALAAAFADWRGWKIAPQIRRQVPERWRWIMPLPLACALYGLLLGLGFTTFVLSFAVWALAGISFAADSAILGVVVGVAFGLGRALPVLWIAPRLGTERGDRCLDRLALEPRLWLGMRRLDAIGLGACAVLLGSSSALAAGSAFATDPSADGSAYAWQQLGGTGMLRTATATLPLPGRLPAVGGANVAWLSGQRIVISNGFPSPAPETIPGPPHATVNALAVSADWLIVRDQSDRGIANLFAVSLRDPARRRYLAGAAIPGAIGRPSIDGSTVVYAHSSTTASAIDEVDLGSGARSVLRGATANVLYANPTLRNGQLLYERSDRCAQELLLGPPGGLGVDRVLLSLPSTVFRDSGYQSGYTHAYNGASVCPNRISGGGGTRTLGATALGNSVAYVSESPVDPARTRIVTVPLG
jgi:hypothetical protein